MKRNLKIKKYIYNRKKIDILIIVISTTVIGKNNIFTHFRNNRPSKDALVTI